MRLMLIAVVALVAAALAGAKTGATLDAKAPVYSFEYVQRLVPVDRTIQLDGDAGRLLRSDYVSGRMRLAHAGVREEDGVFVVRGQISYQLVSGPWGEGMDARLAMRHSAALFELTPADDHGRVDCVFDEIDGEEFIYSASVHAGLTSVYWAFADAHGVEMPDVRLTRQSVASGAEHVTIEGRVSRGGPSRARGWLLDGEALLAYYKDVTGIMEIGEVEYSSESNLSFRKTDE
jgi:hypothetical protein